MNFEEDTQGEITRFSVFEHSLGTLTADAIRSFQNIIYAYYHEHGRKLPWRETNNPYHILISEIMLQQTQVERVTEKYVEFIMAFPDFHSLAQAPLQKILAVWHGLGYNRRALALKRIAEIVVTTYNGSLPSSPEALKALPGIGTGLEKVVIPRVYWEYTTNRFLVMEYIKGQTVSLHPSIRRSKRDIRQISLNHQKLFIVRLL
jgi:endonuclease III-like uncharacterized protein